MKTELITETPNSNNTTLITNTQHWILITDKAPFGLKCLLINKLAGVTYIGILNKKDKNSTHYAGFPKFLLKDN